VNLPRLFKGSVNALGQGEDWPEFFDLSRSGLKQSFVAVLLSLPFYYVCAAAVQAYTAQVNETPATLPALAFFIVLLLYAMMFPLVAYIMCIVFDRQDRFRSWVIVRHWTFFFAALVAAIIMGLSLAGIVPFELAQIQVFALYLGTLVMDIRFAQKIAGFDWTAAIFTGCVIAASGMMMILIGVVQYA